MLSQSRTIDTNTRLPIGKSTLLLTGASGSLGRAIALEHAKAGVAMRLWGRDANRLAATAQAVTACGANAAQTVFDLCDPVAAAQTAIAQDEEERFEIAYLVAGSGETRKSGALVEDPEQIARLSNVNYAAPAAMAAAIADRMARRGGGRIVLVGSAAGHHALPFAAGYASSKAGLARFSGALRIAVAPCGVSVMLAAPGFIDTPAARRTAEETGSARPFQISVEEAARRIVRAGQKGKRHYVTPWPFALLNALDTLLPSPLRERLLRALEP